MGCQLWTHSNSFYKLIQNLDEKHWERVGPAYPFLQIMLVIEYRNKNRETNLMARKFSLEKPP